MKHILLVCMILFGIFTPALSQAEITFEMEEISVGVLDEGKKIDLIFNFQNTGDKNLIIKKINTACGCVVSTLKKREYEPGETGTIEINYNSKGRFGRVNQQIIISTNTAKKFHRLTIIGKVIRNSYGSASIPTEMRKIEFGDVFIGEEYIKEFVMSNEGNRDFKIIKTSHSPEINVMFEKIRLTPKETCKITLRYTPKEAGEFNSLLFLETSALKGRHITIKILGNSAEKVGE